MLFKKKKSKDEVLEEAIDFIKFQIRTNELTRKTVKNINTNSLDEWNRIYKNILKILKSIKE